VTATNERRGGSAGPLARATGTWQLGPSASRVDLHTTTLWGLVKVRAAFNVTEGGGKVGDNGTVTGGLIIDASSVNTKKNKRDNHLRGSDFFDVETYPTFAYTAAGARPIAGNQVTVTGTLTMHGESRPLDVPVTVTEAGPNQLLLEGTIEIDRSNWGITWAKMGTSLINQVTVTALFTRA
jgi:polyisoprenoid-binding protein YceI